MPYGDNFTGTINTPSAGSSTTLTVTIGGASETFTASGSSGAYVPTGGGADTLTCNTTAATCTYTLSDGTVSSFSMSQSSSVGILANYALITQMAKPSGEILNFNYKSSSVKNLV